MIKKLSQGHWPIFILSSFSSMANLFLPIILVRLLTPHDMGIYKIFFLHMSAIPFLFMTGGPINSVYYYVGKPEAERNDYIQSTWQVSLLLSILILIVGFPLGEQLAKWLNFDYQYVMLMLLCGFLWVPGGHFAESKIAYGKTFLGSSYDTAFQFLKVIGFIVIAYTTKNIQYLFMFYAAMLGTKFITTFILGSKNKTISLHFDKAKMKEVFNYCLPISISGCLGFFVDKVDMLILSGQLSAESFAFYSMGCLIVPPLIMLDVSVQKVLIPHLSRTHAEKNWYEASEYFRKAISDIAFLIIPAICGLVFFAKPIVTLLFTDQYLPSVIFLQIFAISYLQYVIPHDAVPRASGHTGWILKIYLLVTPISLISVFIAAKFGGAKEALMTAIIIKFLPKILGLAYSRQIMQWKWSQMFPVKRLLIYSTLALLLSGISLLVRPYFEKELSWFFVCAPIFAILYLGILYIPYKKRSNATV
jgi:O-antigen/teichoic acid export membrane protein